MSVNRSDKIDQLFIDERLGLTNFLYRRIGNIQEAEDLVQESFISFYRAHTSKQIKNSRAFLYRIATNLLIDRYRQIARLRKAEGYMGTPINVSEEATAQDPGPSPEETAAGKEELVNTFNAIQELPQKCRTAFILHRFHNYTYGEIADEMGISKSMVEKHIARALVVLRTKDV